MGNFLVTGHRTSHGAPLADLPDLQPGARVVVRSGDRVLVYRITGTRSTSFRSPASLARQRAAVPGRPGVAPVRPMLTLSTCATPEDHAAGNFWADEFGNPEHRIDKIGVLVGSPPGGLTSWCGRAGRRRLRLASVARCREARPALAGVAQLVERLTCNEDVAGSTPVTGSTQGVSFRALVSPAP